MFANRMTGAAAAALASLASLALLSRAAAPAILPYVLILAGGAAPKLAPHLTVPHSMVDNLVLEGLARIVEARGESAQPMKLAVAAGD